MLEAVADARLVVPMAGETGRAEPPGEVVLPEAVEAAAVPAVWAVPAVVAAAVVALPAAVARAAWVVESTACVAAMTRIPCRAAAASSGGGQRSTWMAALVLKSILLGAHPP